MSNVILPLPTIILHYLVKRLSGYWSNSGVSDKRSNVDSLQIMSTSHNVNYVATIKATQRIYLFKKYVGYFHLKRNYYGVTLSMKFQ